MAFDIETLGEIDVTVGQWCLHKAPVEVKPQLDYDYEIDGQAVTIFEVRPVWRASTGERTRRPFAKFRYVKLSELWQIYWMRQTGKWLSYKPAGVAGSLDEALEIIEADHYGCFFG